MDIQFTDDGQKWIVPFGKDWEPTQRSLIKIRQQFPDAEIVDHIDPDLWEDLGRFITNAGFEARGPVRS